MMTVYRDHRRHEYIVAINEKIHKHFIHTTHCSKLQSSNIKTSLQLLIIGRLALRD